MFIVFIVFHYWGLPCVVLLNASKFSVSDFRIVAGYTYVKFNTHIHTIQEENRDVPKFCSCLMQYFFLAQTEENLLRQSNQGLF